MLNIQLSLKNAFTTLLSKLCLSNKCIKKHGVWKAGAHKPNAFEAIILHAFTAHRTESSLYCHGMSCCQLEFRLTVAYSFRCHLQPLCQNCFLLKKKNHYFMNIKLPRKMYIDLPSCTNTIISPSLNVSSSISLASYLKIKITQ